MKSIQQQVTVEFHAVEAQDIITMLPVYDRIVKEFKKLCKRFNKEFNKATDTLNEVYLTDTAKWAVKKFNQMKCLSKLGFCTSNLNDFRDYEALTVAYHYGLLNEVRDLINNKITPIDALAEFDLL